MLLLRGFGTKLGAMSQFFRCSFPQTRTGSTCKSPCTLLHFQGAAATSTDHKTKLRRARTEWGTGGGNDCPFLPLPGREHCPILSMDKVGRPGLQPCWHVYTEGRTTQLCLHQRSIQWYVQRAANGVRAQRVKLHHQTVA